MMRRFWKKKLGKALTIVVACMVLVGTVGLVVGATPTNNAVAPEILERQGLEDDEISTASQGMLAVGIGEIDVFVNRPVEPMPPKFSQGSLPIKKINTSDGDGIEIVTSVYPEPKRWSKKEILEYASVHTIKETETWLADEIEQYLGGWNDVVIVIHSTNPLKLTPTISKRSTNKYEKETID